MGSLNLISLNIEKRAHLEPVLAFLKHEQPDMVCLQELFDDDLELIRSSLGMTEACFAPMVQPHEVTNWDGKPHRWGVGILSRLPFVGDHQAIVYEEYPPENHPYPNRPGGRPQVTLLTARVEKDGLSYQVGTNHFTWTPNGSVTDEQRVNLANLFKVLDGFPEMILCGDFNAPRGLEIFDALAERYTDTIPAEITTTLDGNLHRAGPLPYVVDGMFISEAYKSEGLEVVDGVSDHCALVARIGRK